MMSDLVIICAASGLLIVLSIVLLAGRGSFLIAGFNTMPKEGKEKYDAKALSKFIGKILLPIGVLLPLQGIERIAGWFVWVFLAVTLALVIFATVYVNTGNRFRN